MVRHLYTLLLLVMFPLLSAGQSAPATDSKPDAATLLQQISRKYAAAKYYHVEAIEEWETNGELSRDWEKSVYTAALSPGNRYRYEAHSQFGWPLKVSDGKTEVNYAGDYHEYTRNPAPESGPGMPKGRIFQNQFGLLTSLGLVRELSRSLGSLISPSYLKDQKLSIGDEQIPCYVIKGRPRYRGGSTETVADTTFWIDKKHLEVRKLIVHEEGSIVSNSRQQLVSIRTTIYRVMEVGDVSSVEAFFTFQPPADATLVEKLSDPDTPSDTLAGTSAPAIELGTEGGKRVTLEDFRGKPVLLDFWGTWCAPCVAAMESLKKLNEEAAPKGLTVISIDEDDEADVAKDFIHKHGVSWSNFHDGSELWRSFPGKHGVPFYVLIDGTGKIAFSRSGANDTELRAAIARLGIQLQPGNGQSKR